MPFERTNICVYFMYIDLFNRNRFKPDINSMNLFQEEEEKIIRKVVEDKMDIRGGYAKPKITDILWIQLVFLPWTLCKWVHFYTRYNLRS